MTTAHITCVVLQCPKCSAAHHIGVTLLDDPFAEPSYTIPAHCTCGAPLDSDATRKDVLDTAAHLMQAGY